MLLYSSLDAGVASFLDLRELPPSPSLFRFFFDGREPPGLYPGSSSRLRLPLPVGVP